MFGLELTLGTRLVTYADDLVILCRRGKAEEALQRLRTIMGKLKLTVNEEKTRICKVPEGEFDFLGYTFGRMYSARSRPGPYRLPAIKRRSIQRAVEKIHALTERSCTWQETTTLVGKVNRTLRGWANVLFGRRVQQGVSGARRLRGGAVAPGWSAPSSTKSGGAGAIHSPTSTGISGSYA